MGLPVEFGFWRRSKDKTGKEDSYDQLLAHLPWPKPQEHPWKGQDVLIRAMRQLVLDGTAQCVAYRGFSMCRLCGCANGCREYDSPGAKWPEGALHYITEHNVKPTQAFIDAVLDDYKHNRPKFPGDAP